MKAIIFVLTFTCLALATDARELMRQLDNSETQLFQMEQSASTSESTTRIAELKHEIFQLKDELRRDHLPNPTQRPLQATVATSDFEVVTAYVYKWTETIERIVVHIQNRSFVYAEWVKIHFYFYKNDIQVGSDYTYIDYDTYQNTGVLPYHDSFAETFIDKMDYDEIRVEFEYDKDAQGQGSALSEGLLQLLEVNVQTGSLAAWSGLVNNGTGWSVQFPKIYANIIKNHNLIDIDDSYLDTECQGNRTIIIDYVIDSPLEAQEIALHNCTENDVNLSGWYLGHKNAPYAYVIPQNTIIDAGSYQSFDNNDLNFAIGTDDEIIYLSNSSKTQIDTWTKDENEYLLESFTTCDFESYLGLPASYDQITYRLNYSLDSPVGAGNIPPNRPRFTLPEYDIAPETPFTFQLYLLDPNDDNIEFQVNWGDGETTGWLGPNESRTLGSIQHAYEWFGNYWITARARDAVGTTSAWCDSVLVFVDWVVPVELSSFTAQPTGSAVLLKWTTASETNNLGFDIERSTDNQNWRAIGFVNGYGSTADSHDYTFEDTNPPDGPLNYRLKQMDADGKTHYSEVVSLFTRPTSFAITSIYPNPFNAETRITFQIEKEGLVEIEIYSINGRHIKTLLSENQDAGAHSVIWDASKVSSGAYIVHVRFSGKTKVKKCLVLK